MKTYLCKNCGTEIFVCDRFEGEIIWGHIEASPLRLSSSICDDPTPVPDWEEEFPGYWAYAHGELSVSRDTAHNCYWWNHTEFDPSIRTNDWTEVTIKEERAETLIDAQWKAMRHYDRWLIQQESWEAYIEDILAQQP